jgi:hypothetical protein
MATFRAQNAGFRMALALEGFEPYGDNRVFHPELHGKRARKAYQTAWRAAVKAAYFEGCGYITGAERGVRWFPFARPSAFPLD